jgi:hypothetical protein
MGTLIKEHGGEGGSLTGNSEGKIKRVISRAM